jgi:hypothetical protein
MNLAGRLRAQEQPFVIATVVAYKSPQSAKPGSDTIIKPDCSISEVKIGTAPMRQMRTK